MLMGASVDAGAVRLSVRAGLLVLALAVAAAFAAPASASTSASAVFAFTGASQQWVVPAGVTSVTVDAFGAQGGASGSGTSPAALGGDGAHASGTLPVTPGETLLVMVGGAAPGRGYESGGFNGGGGSPSTAGSPTVSGGGGGASDVRVSPYGFTERMIVAGGGGGGGGYGYGSGPFASGGAAGGAGGASAVAGTAGTGITNGGGGGGGGAGTASTGGSAGTASVGSGPGGGAGGLGALGQGGARGSNGAPSGGDGGGGGGGYYGGGGGGGGATDSITFNGGGGGGGGGGSSFVDPGAPNAAVVSGVQTGNGTVTITYPLPTSDLSSNGMTFPGTQPQGTASAPQTLTITNNGSAPLIVSGLSFAGADASDFFVGSSSCGGQISVASSCQVTVNFAPQSQGSRTGTLTVSSNAASSPQSVNLSGTGGSLPQGPPGTTGATGATGSAGATGATGAQGAAGKVELVVCNTVTKTITKGTGRARHKVKVKQQQCTTRLVTGPVKFTAASSDRRASLSRAGVIYATGYNRRTRTGSQTSLVSARQLSRGRYTLTLGAGRTAQHETITIR
jgi:hypothetical protein